MRAADECLVPTEQGAEPARIAQEMPEQDTASRFAPHRRSPNIRIDVRRYIVEIAARWYVFLFLNNYGLGKLAGGQFYRRGHLPMTWPKLA